MKKKINLWLLLILFLTNQSMDAQTQAEMNLTSQQDFQKADAELNKIYKEVMKLLDENEKQLLIKAQKDWIKFRDSHCAFEASEFEGGSMQPLIYSSCLTERTKARVEDLKSIFEDKNR
jgi:uncharacterized protein YecT (DUF1311 family)